MPSATTDHGRRFPDLGELGLLAREWLPLARRAIRARPPLLAIGLIAAVATSFVRLQRGGELPALEFLNRAFFPRALVLGDWGRVVSATLLCRDVFMCVSICVSLLVAFGAYEVLAGHLRAAVVMVGGAALGPMSVTAGLGVLQAVGVTWAAQPMGTLDIGASAIVAASSGAIAGVVRQRRLTLALVIFVAGGVLVHHQLADWEHLLVLPIGYTWGRLTGRASFPDSVPDEAKGSTDTRDGRLARARRWVALVPAVAVAAVASPSLLPPPTQPHAVTAAPAASPSSGSRLIAGDQPQPLSPARLVTTTFPSPALGGERGVLVLLPAGYDSGRRTYPVVVFLHGDPGSPRDLISAGDIPAAAQQPDVASFIAVMPDGRGPQVSASWYANIPGQQMGTALTRDLRAWVSTTFRTNGSYSYAGLSSGGYGAAYLAMIDPKPVHAVCGLSGRYTGDIPPLAHANRTAQTAASPLAHAGLAPPLTFLTYGSSDRRTAAPTREYAAALRAAGRDVVVRTYPGAHTWNVWRAAFADCVAEILPADNATRFDASPVVSP